MELVNCKSYAQEILDSVKAIPEKKTLVIISMGDDPASKSYIKGKIKDCEYCGIPYRHEIAVDRTDLYQYISANNCDNSVGGIIIQLPLPDGINPDVYTDAVLSTKDVDGFKDNSPFEPCTPEGIMYLLKKEIGDLTGLKALVIGRGKLVGIPMIANLIAVNCTVTIAHSKTRNLEKLLPHYDIIISAVGKAGLVDLKKCRAKIVIDAGVNRDEHGKLCGDCYNFDPADGSDMKVTPVPGGVGLMTRAMLMKHMDGSGSR